ncbi:hypothetical protein [Amycolatopsis benzoatilytica]|uniref:hypothetical protein n=1 Tax=Amycolatopsis benzoatilytica TaxID=346045 RepID=UPI00036EC682|nr:hypothetical protein [Amycolatopsis benzoatilytica]
MTAIETPSLPDDDHGAEAAPEPSAPASRRRIVAAVVAGFALGASVVGLLWGLAGQRQGANVDAAAACAAFYRAGRIPNTVGGADAAQFTRMSDDAVHRVTGAAELGKAAATFDGAYQQLAQNLDAVNRMVLSSRFDDAAAQADIMQVQQLCARG